MERITIALAKGRPAKSTIELLKKTGSRFQDLHEDSRKLLFYNEDNTMKLIFVKALDVPTYVEKGAADIGIVGKDNIMESEADVYELLDLQIGKCMFAVAGKPNHTVPSGKPLTIATKYPNVARRHFQKKGQEIEVVKLNGSVELAPIIGLADYIVDIVETGNTLRENGLVVHEEMDAISTRLIVNKASFATKSKEVQQFIQQLRTAMEG
ncbi:ATP phosphoribosyltransferase [Compostibacillus humi]|uniref:ATP phosphoribosyltransferase n=1 Tax=Compostibacillus humi TaxID=1245525 RepID=A0A8J3EJK3_9BACI|nr:ATP phosphoribosyltransferase [Compostibacillus humi]GGH72536.1 ATP phosphoribosyltransferase [Compostibacillus humi]HLT55036.1 ATP phosphoribosyltransferase [Bacillota bacterium]